MATLASLVVSLEANVARFESDLNKAEFMAKKAMDTISNVSETAMKAVKGAVAGLAAAYTFDAFSEGIKGAIESAAELDHMAKKTGASVEALSGLKSAAKLSGTSLEDVGVGLQKLSKSMYEAAGGSQKQVDQFKALGISVTDSSGKLRDSGEVMLDVAKKLATMDSGTQAVATAQMLLGKRGAELMPFMQDLADIGELNAKVTSDMAAEAEAYEKDLIRLEGRKKSLYNTIAAGVLPVMRDFTDALLGAGSMTERLNSQAKQLQQDNTIQDWARAAAKAVAFVMDAFDGVIRVVRLVGNALAAVMADIGSALAFLDGIGAEVLQEKSLDPVKRRFAALTSDLKSHAESFNEDMDKILGAPTFLQKLDEQFVKRDAGMKKLQESRKQAFAIPDQSGNKTSAFENYLNSLNVEAVKDQLGKYEAMIQKGQLLAQKEGRLGDMGQVRNIVGRIQATDEAKRVDAFTRSMKDANEQYEFQNSLIGMNARDQEIATVTRKNLLAVEQQIWDAEKGGAKLSIDTQQKLRDEASKSTAKMVEAINARWEAEHAWETGVTKALNDYIDTVSNAAAQSQKLFSDAFKGMEDALVNFVKTGKLDFKTLADSIISDLIRIQIQNSIMKPLAQATSGMSFSGMFSSAGSFLSGLFKADGGPVSGGQPYVVGEQGPEWFVPNGAGTILPNGTAPATSASSSGSQGAVNINFNVQAMDARSFQSAMVQNKAVVVGIVNQALNMRGRYGITG
jgi:lambda family phage tail tape measure protein